MTRTYALWHQHQLPHSAFCALTVCVRLPHRRVQFLFDYEGEVLDQHVYDQRYQAGQDSNEYVVGNRCRDGSMVYMDGTRPERSNLARYMNHSSKEPNCELWTLNEPDLRWLLFTRSDVAMGEELVWDYGEAFWEGRDDRVLL